MDFYHLNQHLVGTPVDNVS